MTHPLKIAIALHRKAVRCKAHPKIIARLAAERDRIACEVMQRFYNGWPEVYIAIVDGQKL